MKIRFLTTIPTERGAFHYGQVIDVAEPTPEMLAWITPCPDGTRRADVVREDRSVTSEQAVMATGRRRGRPPRQGLSEQDDQDTSCRTSA
jgi:hypothetical protein